MEKIFKTLIKENHKLSGNPYVSGKISGIQNCICEYEVISNDKPLFGSRYIEGLGTILVCRTTEGCYSNFIRIIEKMYPGLCEFDFKDENESN